MSESRVGGRVFLPVLLCAVLLLPFAGFVPDDLFIYLQFARNLVERGEIAFNPGEPVNAATSPLWLGLIAAARAAGLDPLTAARGASYLAALLAVAGAVVLTRRATGRSEPALLAGLLLATDPWLLRWGASGMEGAASAAAVVWTFALRTGEGRGTGRQCLAALLLATTPLLRPECALLAAVILTWELIRATRGGGARQLALDLGALALLPGAWALYALTAFGSAVPATAMAKGTLGSAFFGMGFSLLRVLRILATGQGVALLLLLAAAVTSMRRRRDRAREGSPVPSPWPAVAAWACLLIALYTLRHVSVYTRYLLTLTPLLAAGGAAAAAPLLRQRPGTRRAAIAVTAVGIVANLTFTGVVVLPATWSYASHMKSVNVELARELARSTPAEAVVAVPNIGAIGYLSGRKILDLNGLITPELVPYKREGRLADYLRAHPPDYLIEIHPEPGHALKEPPGLRLRPLRSLPFRHMFLRQSEPLWYTLYEVEGPLGGGDTGPEGR